MDKKESDSFVFGNLLRRNLESYKVNNPGFSTLAQKGDDELVEKFLSENVHITGSASEQKQSQLYIAAFWGFYDVVRTLVDGGADVNTQNAGSLWTPLHAATFQEHGK
ncbi:oxysterol-binding -related 1-like, partial [Paramuricea clavata]